MKKTSTLAALLLAISATAAMAQSGLNLNWDECTIAGGTQNKIFACNVDAGLAFALNASVIPPSAYNTFASASAIIDVHVDAATLPDWWLTNAGQCRANRITISFAPGVNVTSCSDIWNFSTIVEVSAIQQSVNGANRVRINGLAAIPAGSEIPLVADGTEYWTAKVSIFRNNTTTCTGCSMGACIVFNESKLLSPTEPAQVITNEATRRWVTWNGGGGTDCPTDTPAINRTWGAVKSLYR
jgi:hypothetical protein